MRHDHNGNFNILLYETKPLGEGKYYLRGVAKNIAVEDEFNSIQTRLLKVTKVISLQDSKGKFNDPEIGKNALFEVEAERVVL